MSHLIKLILALALFAVVSAQTFTYCANATKGGGVCESDDQCGGADAGSCVNGTCVCSEWYFAEFCDYKAKDSYTAGLVGLTLIAGIGGVTCLYLENLTWGITQLVLTVAPGIVGWVLTCCGIRLGGLFQTVTGAMWLWSLSSTIIWGARTLDYSACDGNGYPIMNNVNGNY
ncbi:DNA packaging ATPase [Faustovirus]|nr:DNA packaging ATPase [Faustovirus]